MQKRLHLLLLSFLLLFSVVAGCSSAQTQETAAPTTEPPEAAATLAPAPVETEPAATQAPVSASPSDIPAPTEAPDESPAVTAASIDWRSIYTTFLEENYARLSELCYGGIAGVGFIDLDLDSVPELLLFDAGASASMGLQIFDIAGEAVECVSANVVELGEAFGGTHYSTLYVNANYFDDFRLVQAPSGERFCYVVSGNGALDFSYSEIIRFDSGPDSVVTLTSVLYQYAECDPNTGETLSSRYTREGSEIDGAEASEVNEAFFSDNTDLDYEAFGVFIWEDRAYSTEYDGSMAMVQAALDGYVPMPE